jgi:hypothetical protein
MPTYARQLAARTSWREGRCAPQRTGGAGWCIEHLLQVASGHRRLKVQGPHQPCSQLTSWTRRTGQCACCGASGPTSTTWGSMDGWTRAWCTPDGALWAASVCGRIGTAAASSSYASLAIPAPSFKRWRRPVVLSGGLGLCFSHLPSVRSRAGPWRPRRRRAVHPPRAVSIGRSTV